jgi:hypothetical protein
MAIEELSRGLFDLRDRLSSDIGEDQRLVSISAIGFCSATLINEAASA